MRRMLVVTAIIILSLIAFMAPVYAQGGGDITRFGENVVVREGETVDGNITVFGGNVTVDGIVEQNVTLFGGNLRIDGRVGENVTHFGGNTTLGNTAVIEGDFTHFGGTLNRSPGARIEGSETTGVRFRFFSPLISFLTGLFTFLFTLVLAIVVVALLPDATAVVADTVQREPLSSAGAGLLATILIPVVFLLLVLLIIVGWILIPFFILGVIVSYFYGYVGVSRWLGRRILESTSATQQSPIVQVLIGVLVLGIVGFIPILGWLVALVANLVGLGAVILSKYGTGKPWFRRGEAGPPPPEAERGAA